MRLADAVAPRGATLLERALAYLIDAVATFLLWVALILILAQGDVDALADEPVLGLVAGMLFLAVPFLYFVAAEGLTGTTLGKRAVGLRVIGPEGGEAGLFAATVRNVLRLAWALGPAGPLFLLLDAGLVQYTEADQRVGDLAAETRVVALGDGWFSSL